MDTKDSIEKDIQEIYKEKFLKDLDFYVDNPNYALALMIPGHTMDKAVKYNIISFSVKKEDMKIHFYVSFLIKGAKRIIKAGRINMFYDIDFDDDFIEKIIEECRKPNGSAKLESNWKTLIS